MAGLLFNKFKEDRTDDLDAYDSKCDDISSAKAVLMANLSSYDSDVVSEDGESLESYYSRFYKMMNELTRNQCKGQELKNVSYHKLYDILKQHQHEVNEIRAEKIARVANPLTLVAQQQQVYHPQTYPTHYTQNSSTRSQQAATRNRGKAIVHFLQPIYDQEPSMVNDDDDETSKDKEIDKLMALTSLSFKKIYKPTNNNLRTSSNTSRANQDNSPRIHKNAGYEHQRLGNVAGARETVGLSVVRKSGIQCYNCKEYGHVARECQKLKRAKDAAYHREKMLSCKQEEARIQLNAEQADWKDDTDDESDDQELEAHYMCMAKIQEVSPDAVDSGPIFDTEPEQKVQNDDYYDVFAIELFIHNFIIMSNTNNNMQTQTSNTLHNAIMEAGSKDRPPMLAPGNYIQWKSIIKRYIETKPNHELIHYCLTNPPYELGWIDKEIPISEGSPITRTKRFQETYKNFSQDIRDQLNAEAEAVQIILTGIDNDIYSTVDACPNACEMWKEIERLKQGELINVQDLETNLYCEFRKYTSQDGESLEPYYSRNRGKAIVNSPQPVYDQEPSMVTEANETSQNKEIDKLMALISLSFKKIYKPNNNNLQTSSNTSRANQDNSLRINRSVGYENQRTGNVARARETVEQADWRDDTDDDELEDQELEAHYIDEIDQNDDDNDLANERELLTSLIEKLKCKIDESKNRMNF
nr:hypothetical protein [Tanacetum cinerariifolium]